jgi:AAA domain
MSEQFAAAELAAPGFEIPWLTHQAIESWRRVLDKTHGDKRPSFGRASLELLRLASKEDNPDVFRAIVNVLDGIAQVAGIDTDEAQAIMAAAAQAPPDSWAPQANTRERMPNVEEQPSVINAEDTGTPFQAPAVIPPLTIAEWLERDIPAPDLIMGDWLSTTTRALLVAPTGLGKTNLALAIGMNVAAGRNFLHWQGRRPCTVLYIDGEMARRVFRERIAEAANRLGERPVGFHALSHEDVEHFMPLNTAEGQSYVEQLIDYVGKPDLIVFDSVMCLTVGDLKDGESWAQIMPWVRSLTRRCTAQLWIHHTGHDQSRGYGDKTREWQLDTVMHMEAIARTDSDVSFSLEFRKARERTPATRADFQTTRVALLGDQWTVEATGIVRPGHVSPLGQKFLTALQNALTADSAEERQGRRCVGLDLWRAGCVGAGLLEPGNPVPAPTRAQFSKYRRELIAANRVACDERFAWLVK